MHVSRDFVATASAVQLSLMLWVPASVDQHPFQTAEQRSTIHGAVATGQVPSYELFKTDIKYRDSVRMEAKMRACAEHEKEMRRMRHARFQVAAPGS